MSKLDTIVNLRRELEKAHGALLAAEDHLGHHAAMNAALHCDDKVIPSPLHAKVQATRLGIEMALVASEVYAEGRAS